MSENQRAERAKVWAKKRSELLLVARYLEEKDPSTYQYIKEQALSVKIKEVQEQHGS